MGATGAVGKHVVSRLLSLNAFTNVTVLTRRPLDYTGPNEQHLVRIETESIVIHWAMNRNKCKWILNIRKRRRKLLKVIRKFKCFIMEE